MAKIASQKADARRGIDHIGVSVCFIVHDGQGHILLHKRGPKARDERGNWDIGGGAIEFGESLDDAVKREIKEEFSCEPLDIQFLTAYEAHREHEGQPTHWIALLHAVKVDPKKVKIGEPDKISQIGWFTSQDLPEPLHSQFWRSFPIGLEQGFVK